MDNTKVEGEKELSITLRMFGKTMKKYYFMRIIKNIIYILIELCHKLIILPKIALG